MERVSQLRSSITIDRLLNGLIAVLILVFVTVLFSAEATKTPVQATGSYIEQLEPLRHTEVKRFAELGIVPKENVATSSREITRTPEQQPQSALKDRMTSPKIHEPITGNVPGVSLVEQALPTTGNINLSVGSLVRVSVGM